MPTFLPHGSLTLVALFFAATAYAFALFAAFGSKTFKLEFQDTEANIANDRFGSIRFGYFGYCALGNCQDYEEREETEAAIKMYSDAFLLTGVSSAFVMTAVGGVFVLFLLLSMCIRMKRCVMVTMGIVFGVCVSLPALSLLISGIGYGSPECFNHFDDDQFLSSNFTWNRSTDKIYFCRPDIGSILAFVSAILWIVALSMTCCCLTGASDHSSQHDMQHPAVDEAAAYSTYSPSKNGDAASSAYSPSKNGDAASYAPSYAASTGLEDDTKSAASPR